MNELIRFEEMHNMAKVFKESGMFPTLKSEAQAIVKIQAGAEIGIGPFASIRGIDIIQGNPQHTASLQAALIKRSGDYKYKSIEHTDKICRLEFFEKWGDKFESVGFSEFTIAQATQAGLTSNPTWKKYPQNMLFARALSNGAKWYCAGVFITGTYNESDEFEYTAQVSVDNSGIEALKQTPAMIVHELQAREPVVIETEEVPLDDLADMKEAMEKATTQEELKAIAEAIKSYGEMPDDKRKEMLAVFNRRRKELK